MKINSLIASAPHVRHPESVTGVMLDVIIALIPAGLASVFYFGIPALLVIATSVVSCVLFEYFWNKLLHRPNSTGDLSAIVTGLLLAYSLPPKSPLWIVLIGALFAIIVTKQFFGGIGHNFMNPALCGRAFLLASWSGHMTYWTSPSFFGADAVSSSTPLAALNAGNFDLLPSFADLFFGNKGGSLGEVSVALLLLGAIYLFVRRIISWHIPVSYILSTALVMGIFGGGTDVVMSLKISLFHVCSGGLILGAFFMATDYTTTPVTPIGHIIMGVGCGALTALIRLGGGYAEGVTYAILVMNAITPLIDKFVHPRVFGHTRVKKEAKQNV